MRTMLAAIVIAGICSPAIWLPTSSPDAISTDLTEREVLALLAQRGVVVGSTTSERLPDGRVVRVTVQSIRVGKGGHVVAEVEVHADIGK